MAAMHTHAADLEATADFLNTRAIDDGAPVERLVTADEAIAFLTARRLAHDDALRAQAAATGERAWLDRIRQARSALRELWDAEVERRAPDPSALAALNSLLRAAPTTELTFDAGRSAVGHAHTEDPTGEALALLAEPLVEAVGAGSTERLRVCANDECRWAFEDTSRAGRRRWCDMSSCGNVAKARRYRARHREAEAAGAPAGDAPGG